MKSKQLRFLIASSTLVLALGLAGCGRQTRGTSDAHEHRALTPEEGGAVSTRGAAGHPESFGDQSARDAKEGATAVDRASTAGPGSRERKEVTIEVPVEPPPNR